MSNDNTKSSNGNGNTTTQKKKRSAAAQARRTAKWQAQKEAKKTAAIAKQTAKKAEEERKTKSVLEMFPTVMSLVGAQGFMPNLKGVRGTSKQIKTALNTTPLFQNANRATIYPGTITLLNHYLENQQWDKAMEVINQGVPKRILEVPLRTIPPMSPLQYTYEWNQLPLFQKLLEKGANPNRPIEYNRSISSLLTLIASSFSPNATKYTLLLLRHGADLNKRDSRGYSALDYAIRARKYDMIQLLIEKGASLETPNENGYTPLLSAIAISDKRAFHLMVAKGININKQTGPNGLSPLKVAVINGNTAMVKEILALDPELDQKDPLGNTALHYATLVNAVEKIALLKTAGANPRLSNKEGVTAISIAQGLRDNGDSRAYNLLVE
jgi:ankyrin repeat protein